jgi:ketosteroid isomerase-like protein
MGRFVAGATFILVLTTGGSWANGQEPGKKDKKPGKESVVSSELEQFDQRWNRAWLEKDAAAVERMMAEDYVYVAPTGQVFDREAILRIIRSPSYRLHHGTLTNVVVRMLGDNAAVIRDRFKGEGEMEGKQFKDDHSCVRVCARVRGEWQIVVEQCTANKP